MTLAELLRLVRGDTQAERAVPRRGTTAALTTLTAAALAFLAILVIAVSSTAGRFAGQWADELAGTVTVQLPAATDGPDAALAVLAEAPGVTAARALTAEEQQALLAPWFGTDLPLDTLPLPQLIEVTVGDGYTTEGLTATLNTAVPGAVVEDNGAWRAPLRANATRLRVLGWLAVIFIAGAMAGLVSLAAQATLAANTQVISVLRLVGATDGYIARSFVRRFVIRGALGAFAGAVLGLLAIRTLPALEGLDAGQVAPIGLGWAVILPLFAAIVAFVATQFAARRTLKEIP